MGDFFCFLLSPLSPKSFNSLKSLKPFPLDFLKKRQKQYQLRTKSIPSPSESAVFRWLTTFYNKANISIKTNITRWLSAKSSVATLRLRSVNGELILFLTELQPIASYFRPAIHKPLGHWAHFGSAQRPKPKCAHNSRNFYQSAIIPLSLKNTSGKYRNSDVFAIIW